MDETPNTLVHMPPHLMAVRHERYAEIVVKIMHRFLQPDGKRRFHSDPVEMNQWIHPESDQPQAQEFPPMVEDHYQAFSLDRIVTDGYTLQQIEGFHLLGAACTFARSINAYSPNCHRVFTAPIKAEAIREQHTTPIYYEEAGVCISSHLYMDEKGRWGAVLNMMVAFEWKIHFYSKFGIPSVDMRGNYEILPAMKALEQRIKKGRKRKAA